MANIDKLDFEIIRRLNALKKPPNDRHGYLDFRFLGNLLSITVSKDILLKLLNEGDGK